MPFSDTAEYFETRARTARSEERRREFIDAARFYRQLARITPTFPAGYRRAACFDDRCHHLDKRAMECIAMAEVMHDPECKEMMLRLAGTYEQVSRSLRAAE